MGNLMKYFVFFLSFLTFCACDHYDFSGFIVSPSERIEKRFDYAMKLNDNPKVDTVIKLNTDSYSMALISDIHVKTTADNLARFINTVSADNSLVAIAFVGDITDRIGGLKIAHDTIVSNLPTDLSWYPVIGNHDLYFNQYDTYREIFGSSVYYFVVDAAGKRDLFICLDSGCGTLGRRQTQWLKNLLKKRCQYRHTVVLTHTNFWDTDFSQFPTGSFSKEETMSLARLFTDYEVEYVVSGHDHHRQERDFNGVKYFILDAVYDGIEHPTYLRLGFSAGITSEFIEF